MKRIDLKEFCFHDCIIRGISLDEGTLTLNMPNTVYDGQNCDLKLEIRLDESDLSIYYIKQYPCFGSTRIQTKESNLGFLKHIFEKGGALEIVDFLVSTTTKLAILNCEVLPCSKRRGVSKRVVFKINYQDDYFTLKRSSEK